LSYVNQNSSKETWKSSHSIGASHTISNGHQNVPSQMFQNRVWR